MSDSETTALLQKLQAKAKAACDDAARKPVSVSDAKEQAKQLQDLKKKTKEHMKMAVKIPVPPGQEQEFLALTNGFAGAVQQVKHGIERTSTVIDAANKLPRMRRKRIQVVFALDATSSMNMGSIMDKLKDTIDGIVTALQKASSLDVRVGFQAYRDYNDDPRFEALPLTDDLARFRNELAEVKAKGGGDAAEDVLGGLMKCAKDFEWGPKDIHVVVWCGDAPGHGLCNPSQKGTISDDHPGGDKYGLTVKSVCDALKAKRIVLACLRVTRHTDHMVHLLNNEMANGGSDVFIADFTDLGTCEQKINQVLVGASAVSATVTVDGRSWTVEKRDVPKKDPQMTGAIPIATITGNVLYRGAMELSSATALDIVKDLLEAKTAEQLHMETSGEIVLKIEIPYFAAGGVRMAHMAEAGSRKEKVVAKDFQWGPDELQRHLDEARSTLIAGALACLFRVKVGLRDDAFKYIDTQIFIEKVPGTAAKQFGSHVCTHYSVERYSPGEFLKFNSNNGFVGANFELAQAFSHFTWHVTDGQMMVLDLQGWCTDKTEYRFTDPAIQTTDRTLLETATNRGVIAMEEFLKVHVCGPICKNLGIPNVAVPS